MSSFFDNLDFSDTLSAIRDKAGIRFADVYILTKRDGQSYQLERFLPTPSVKFISHEQQLDSGGVVSVGDVELKQIPVSRYSESDLMIVTNDQSIRKYWVISGKKLEPKAYTTKRISRGELFWDVTLQRFKSLNPKDLTSLLEAMSV